MLNSLFTIRNQAVLPGPGDGLGPRAEVEFVVDVRDVIFDGAFRNEKRLGDACVVVEKRLGDACVVVAVPHRRCLAEPERSEDRGAL